VAAGSERGKKVARVLVALGDRERELPEFRDQVVAIPPLRTAYSRQIVGENLWLLYALHYVSAVEENEIHVIMVLSSPPVPVI
jgi:hypothetical protein